MRIAQVNLQRDWGGAEQHVLYLAEGLSRNGHEVLVVCHPAGRLRSRAEAAGLPVAPVWAANQLDPTLPARLAARLRSHAIDVMHLHSPKDYVAGPRAARAVGNPAVALTRHIMLPLKPRMTQLYNSVDAVLTYSEAAAEFLAGQGVARETLHMVRGAMALDPYLRLGEAERIAARSALGLGDTELAVGITGRLVPCKGHAFLLQALAEVSRPESITLLVAGEGPEAPKLQQLAGDLGIAPKVRWLGFRDDMPSLLSALDIAVLATSDRQAEQLPYAVMEAMAAGLPVIATDVGAVREMVEHGVSGLLAPPADAEALTGALDVLTADQALRRSYGIAGRRRAESLFALPNMIHGVEDVYRSLLHGPGRRHASPDALASTGVR